MRFNAEEVIHVVRGEDAASKDQQMKTQNQASTTTKAAAAAAQGAPVAPKKATSTKASPKKVALAAKKGAEKSANKKTPSNAARKAATEEVSTKGRTNSKSVAVLDLLRRKDGATLGEIMKATDWQAHSIRRFISGPGPRHKSSRRFGTDGNANCKL